jgi:hypothetical protein
LREYFSTSKLQDEIKTEKFELNKFHTNRKITNVWGIPSMETYLTSIMIRKKRH